MNSKPGVTHPMPASPEMGSLLEEMERAFAAALATGNVDVRIPFGGAAPAPARPRFEPGPPRPPTARGT